MSENSSETACANRDVHAAAVLCSYGLTEVRTVGRPPASCLNGRSTTSRQCDGRQNMALVVLLRGVNVRGYRHLRPGSLGVPA